MDSHLRWKTYKGVRLLIADFFGVQIDKELNEQAEGVTRSILEMKRTDLLLLVDVSNTVDSKSSQIKFAECAKRIKPSCKKIAVLGITPVKQAIVNIINRFSRLEIKSFGSETEACDWLLQ